MQCQLNKHLLALKKGKHVSRQTAKQNRRASLHGKCRCFVSRNAPALFGRVLMMCVKVISPGNKFHISNHSDLCRKGWGGQSSVVIILKSKKMCLSRGGEVFTMRSLHLFRYIEFPDTTT